MTNDAVTVSTAQYVAQVTAFQEPMMDGWMITTINNAGFLFLIHLYVKIKRGRSGS